MPKYRTSEPAVALPRRTLDYLDHGAAEGLRNAELFDAACQMRDAGHPLAHCEDRLLERALADGLPEAEARQTIRSVFSRAAREPISTGMQRVDTHSLRREAPPQPAAMPLPIDSGLLQLLDACFRPGEHVAIAPASESEDGEVMPRRGVTLPVEEWKSRITAKGGIDRIFGTKLGLFIRINPMTKGGARNEDVTAFRHVLVEFDRDGEGKEIPKLEQYRAVVASGMPVAALIDSGNKSLHAWIRVDAPNEEEYKRRVAVVWDWFSKLHLDKQNRNPSRLSRCPDGWRTVEGEPRQQRLLQLQHGAASWNEWESARNAPPEDAFIPVSTLAAYDISKDANNVLGQRWLCRGGSLVMVGQSGIGKSSLCMQLMILWALGEPAFGICPVGPLRSVLIQAENDVGDLAEMYQGVRQGMGLTQEQEALLDQRIFIYRDTTRTGAQFVAAASGLVERHKPDLIWADPLLNYIGDDISEQRIISEFCCHLLNEVSLRTGVIWCLLHHTGKPSKDPKAGSHWTASDLAYSGLGSSALTNWSRETAVLVRLKTKEGEPPTFQLSMTKRRKRAGLVDSAGQPTDTIFLRHSSHGGICWEQCEAPVGGEDKPTGRYKMGRKPGFDLEAFKAAAASIGGAVTRQNAKQVAAIMNCSERTVWNLWKRLKINNS